MKKLISIALVALMAAGGAVSANAAVKQNKDYQILSSKLDMNFDYLFRSSYMPV